MNINKKRSFEPPGKGRRNDRQKQHEKRKTELLFFLVYQSLFLTWCLTLHTHFFVFLLPHRIGLIITASMPLVLWKMKRGIPKGASLVILILLPISLFHVLEWGMLWYDKIQIIIYGGLLSTGVTLLWTPNLTIKIASLVAPIMVWVLPYSFRPNQRFYLDRVVKTLKTGKGEVDIVRRRNNDRIYYDRSLLISSEDGHMVSETLVHSVLPFFEAPDVLLIGGDHNMSVRELAKYPKATTDHIPYDHELHAFIRKRDNTGADQKINPIPTNPLRFLEKHAHSYDVIIIDMPDPHNPNLASFYQKAFYKRCIDNLSEKGILIANSGDLYAERTLVENVDRYLSDSGMHTQQLQAQVPTLGHRSWVLAAKNALILEEIPPLSVPTKWLNKDAFMMMRSQGKKEYPQQK